MGGSSSRDEKITNITTTTKTTMGDVGLTGQNAVDLAAILETGAIEQTRISTRSLDNIIQLAGKTAQQLVGGASDLVKTQSDLVRTEGEIATQREEIAAQRAEIAAQGEMRAQGQSSDLVKIAPLLAIAAIIILGGRKI